MSKESQIRLFWIFFFAAVISLAIVQKVFGDLATNPYMIMYNYCIAHADREAAGENVINDLVNSGIIDSYYAGMTCQQVHDIVIGPEVFK